MYGANVIIFEGILTFYNADICQVIMIQIFKSIQSLLTAWICSYWT